VLWGLTVLLIPKADHFNRVSQLMIQSRAVRTVSLEHQNPHINTNAFYAK
jgi:hypothetical protein